MSDVKWIKIVTNIFDDEKIYAIETLPDGLIMEVVWFKILCLAGKCNSSGFLTINNKLAYTDEMLAKVFRLDIGVVQRALDVFQKLEMIEMVDNAYMVSNWTKYQNNERLEQIKEQNRERQKRFRERQKLALEEKNNVTSNVTNNVNCSISNSNSYINNKDNDTDINTIKNIVSYLNKICNTRYRHNTESTKRHIRARLNEGFTEQDFYEVIDKKHAQWGGDPKMAEYLRPETLFGTKFESYLNQKDVQKPTFNIDDWS